MIKINKCKFKKDFAFIHAGNIIYLLTEYKDSRVVGLQVIYPNIQDRLNYKFIIKDHIEELVLTKEDYLEFIDNDDNIVDTYDEAYRFIYRDKESIKNINIEIFKEEL